MTLPSSSSLRSRFALGAAWSVIGTVVSQGLTLIASVVTARFLGKTGFGELGMINSTVGVFGLLAGLGLGLSTTKYVAELRVRDPERTGRIIGLTYLVALGSSGLIFLCVVILAPWISARILNSAHLGLELRIGALLLLLNTLNGIQTGTLSGFEAFKEIAQANLIRGIVSFPLLIAGVVLWQLPGAVWGLVVSACVGWTLNNLMLRKKCRETKVRICIFGAWDERAVLWNFSLPALLADIAAGPAMWAANAILVRQRNGYAEMGLFSAANQWRSGLMFIPNILLQVALPLLSSFNDTTSESDRIQFTKTFEITQTLTLAIVFPLGILLMFFSDFIIGFYGRDFYQGASNLIGIAFTVMIMAISAATGPAIQAVGRMWLGCTLNLCWGAVVVVLVFIGAPRLGSLSLAYAPGLAYVVLAIVEFVYLRRQLAAGALSRAVSAILFAAMAAIVSEAVSPRARVLLAVPFLAMSLFATLTIFTAHGTRQTLSAFATSWRTKVWAIRIR